MISEDPLTVRLKFEPAGRAVGETGKYYQMVKENQCVVCGDQKEYIRKNVVPREYRKYFPSKLLQLRTTRSIKTLQMSSMKMNFFFDYSCHERSYVS